jgi:hypothetical protein
MALSEFIITVTDRIKGDDLWSGLMLCTRYLDATTLIGREMLSQC